eukprot:Pompholyxophrys_punicea_v1_NODE_439_length_1971_cov_8.485908.p1 type:complete len:125 gc:universal NODE_439_length_1971_cov_8.485908:498-872(+)
MLNRRLTNTRRGPVLITEFQTTDKKDFLLAVKEFRKTPLTANNLLDSKKSSSLGIHRSASKACAAMKERNACLKAPIARKARRSARSLDHSRKMDRLIYFNNLTKVQYEIFKKVRQLKNVVTTY